MDENKINTLIGKRLKMRRITLGLSQKELGAQIGITFQQIQKYENGANSLNASRLYSLSKVLRVPTAFFFEDIKQPFNEPNRFTMNIEDMHASSRESLELSKAFQRIKNSNTRKKVSDLTRALILESAE